MLINFHRKVSKLLLEYIVKDQSHTMAVTRAGRARLEGVRQHLPPPAACQGRSILLVAHCLGISI